ncbi:MAG TPA: response regulator transcription factor [Bryobacteraceae bacterium]|nr:response regulator transcription factor [Bryobacteraceae bacterium]
MQVLVVEDEQRMAELLRQGLEEEGHSVVSAGNGRDALAMAESYSFDAIVLDVMLPGLDGFSVARKLRAARNQTPILMLTARDATHDMVEGLNLGADDYLVKPFSFDVLLARLRAVSRRGPIAQPVTLQVADLTLNPAAREVTRGGRRIALTRTEYSLLELLMKRAGRVVARENLIEAVWGFETDVRNNTLDAFIRLLREKVDSPEEIKLIHTVRGVGYCLRSEEAA